METRIRCLTDPSAAEREALSDLLIDTVDGGASIGFLPPRQAHLRPATGTRRRARRE